MNKDTIFYIQQFVSDSDFLYQTSLVNKHFCLNKKRSQIITNLNKKRIFQVFGECDDDYIYPKAIDNLISPSNFDYLFEFLTSKTITECLQWYANSLLNFIPFHKYENKHHYIMFKIFVNKYTSSNGIYSPVRIHRYSTMTHCVYRCRYLNYHQIKDNLTVKALIY